MSVPVRLSDGSVYGRFCCFSAAPDRGLDRRDNQFMSAIADFAAYQIERRKAATEEQEEKRRRVSAAIRQRQFSPVYQPIFRLDDRKIVSFECLTRFAAQPLRTPDAWFAEAAEVGLEVDLELAAITMGLTALPRLPDHVSLSVNASPRVATSPEFQAVMAAAPLSRIVIEITEHAHVPDYGALHQALAPLRAAGLKLAVDDAGAGFASLRHILAISPDLIKLDLSLIHDLDRDPARRALTRALTAFAEQTGSRIIAEGVETEAELRTLRELGVGRAQGYLLGRPMDIEGAAALV